MRYSPEKTGFIMFAASLAIGLVIFFAFGFPAGVFSSGKGWVNSFTGSPFGWIALFGAMLVIASPLIGLSTWAYDRAIRAEIERQQKKKATDETRLRRLK